MAEGLFAGRFIYINRTSQGELFGSDRNSNAVTMYIENAGLSPSHAEIKFVAATCQYFLTDAGSVDGTWVRIRWNRSVEIAPGQEIRIGDSLIEVRQGQEITEAEEVEQWLSTYQLQRFAGLLNEKGFCGLSSLRHRLLQELPSMLSAELSNEDYQSLEMAAKELDRMWPSDAYPTHTLEFSVRPATGSTPCSGVTPSEGAPAGDSELCSSGVVASVGWAGGTIELWPVGVPAEEKEVDDALSGVHSNNSKDSPVGQAHIAGWLRPEQLRIGYSFGRYYVHFSERSAESEQKGWVRLRADQSHWLMPQDLFSIGTLEFQVLRFNAASYSEQGLRATMEDEDILIQDLATSNWRQCSYFGIYDGHGGRDCVNFVRRRLHVNIVAALHARGGLDKSVQVHQDMHDSLMQGFLKTDQQFLGLTQGMENGGSGSTAVVACLVGGWVWCANVGDSRALLCRNGRALQLSLDHKPSRADESKRIEQAGGFVSFHRVLGRLAVSRAFGDEEYKVGVTKADNISQPLVIAEPEIRVEQLTPEDEFLFMACDGLFAVFSCQEAVDFLHSRLAAMPPNEQDPQRAVQDIVHEAIHERRSRDNVTALLVTFRRADAAVKALLGSMDKTATGKVQYEDFVDWLGQGLDSTVSRNFRSAYEKLQHSDNESEATRSPENSQSLGDFKPPKGKAKSSSAPGRYRPGVKCDKILEFGKPIRNAICIGGEVWTVDWHGVVTVRDRDNASKVLGTIPTDRFVWSMLHMKPGLMWMGQEAFGISLFDTKKKEPKGTLTGGHTGGVTCLACDDSMGDNDAEEFPNRKAWSGSNDFTIREWYIHTWRSKKAMPAAVKEDKEATIVELGRWKVGILKGLHMHGHKNGLKTLLKLGPILWSGADDGSIRLWRCIDGECMEIVEDAHTGSVNKLTVVKCFVWSAGSDGLIKEWNMTGEKRQCLRQVAPPGSEKGIYALLPLGHDVWVCGHHPTIQVFSQRDMAQTSAEDGHKPYVSNLIGVDRVESKIVWSTSFGDRKLKVWRHTIRGEEASVDELKAANILYQQEEETQAERIGGYLKRIQQLQESQELLDERNKTCQELKEALEALRQIFAEAGLEDLLADPEALKAFVKRGAALEEVLRRLGLEDLLEDPEEVGRLLSLMRKIQEILERCGMTELLDDPAALEAVLQRYKAMKAAFEAHGFDELFEDPVKLESFLGTHRQVRDVFEEFQQMHLLEDAEAARSFFQQRQLDLEESSSTATTLKSLEAEMAELRRQLQELQEQREAMRASFEKHGFRPLFDDVEKLDSFLQSHREVRDVFQEANHEDLLEDAEKARIFLQMFDQTEDDRRFMAKLREVFEEAGQSRLLEEYEATTDAGDDDHADEEAEDEEDDAEADDAEEAEEADEPDERDEDVDEDEEGEEEEGEPRESLKDKPSEDTDELHTASKGKTVAAAPIRPQQSFRALRAHLFRTNAFERVLREVGMEHLLDDPNELGRLLRLLKELMSILETYGLKEVEHDPTRLAEVLSAYRALEAAFKEYDMSELFEDPEYSLKAFLRNHHRIRAEFDKYGLGYLFDSVPSMRDFLARYKDMEDELKAMKAARAGEKLAERDAEMGRLESRLLKKEEEIEALKERLKEFEQLGDVETIQKWKADSEELKRITRLYNSVSSRLAELERLLAAKEREREEAEARERMMAVKYKELDIFKLDIIARELKALDNELQRVGSGVKGLNQAAARLRNYDEQQGIGNQSDQLLDQCKQLRSHIRDVINKCLSETQKMHIGVGIDDPLAAGDLKDGGTMIATVYEEIERVDHGSSKAAKLRQQDESRRR
ncbi:Probable protein phosphatase 2C 3 (PP2C 3) [Durusdinium trenchii]|uniref:Probable protein phosphatase 2C 3 (PP2C 3) n=1 Tax=Durusdinium trenchii TaxID=1381693 RepID=A0ABP0QQG3_9DINO